MSVNNKCEWVWMGCMLGYTCGFDDSTSRLVQGLWVKDRVHGVRG